MKGIEFITPTTTDRSGDDLPWLKDWVKTTKEYDKDFEVFTVYPGDKGLLILTGSYKSFIFRKDSVHNYLVEALEQWVKTGESVSPLIVVSTIKGRPTYGLNHDKPKVIWREDEGTYVSIRLDEPINLPTGKINPFLSTPPSDPNSPTRNNGKKPIDKSK